jgi:hypothetical protein
LQGSSLAELRTDAAKQLADAILATAPTAWWSAVGRSKTELRKQTRGTRGVRPRAPDAPDVALCGDHRTITGWSPSPGLGTTPSAVSFTPYPGTFPTLRGQHIRVPVVRVAPPRIRVQLPSSPSPPAELRFGLGLPRSVGKTHE